MKKIIIFSFCIFNVIAHAQIGVETETIAEHAILDFPSSATKGILLPKIEDKSTVGTTSGTFIFDNSSKKVAFYGNEEWIEMTESGKNNIPATATLYNKEETNADGVVIEDGTSISNGEVSVGVLTLESNEKALALPVVENVNSLPNPIAGTICYDKSTSSLAIFNGIEWSFWR